ncbi:hypothetical protein [Methanosarcina sp. UBA411]|uniref:hypothetical protein n=1 Tax=Methanosarcina sp. UBA411 TaxID=1915589 RepID=UPI0025D06FAB|nr:hypothetical protein [Methanosarcina sp. UBA411]
MYFWEEGNSQNPSCSIFVLEDDDVRLSYMLEGSNDYSPAKTGEKKKTKKADGKAVKDEKNIYKLSVE